MCAKFGLIYAGAQKNIGPSGLTVVIVREDLHRPRARRDAARCSTTRRSPTINRMLNTPPTFAWYMAGLVFKWLKSGGRRGGDRRTQPRQGRRRCMPPSTRRVSIENSVATDARSWMNVTFTLQQARVWMPHFLAEAAAAGLHGLKGHRVLGGMRASIYNAMPLAGVEALIAFMREFERRHA